ncbi:PAS domain-containing protein [Rubellimicrobium arenae]|uniref:PAS domain-containing protein n=1 Tax=Rubellimicrobium arenae TaxID=2817372 RepID=UPI001B30AB62|nr:PAS domain-containing protein [Rubellimicrobium arenae]
MADDDIHDLDEGFDGTAAGTLSHVPAGRQAMAQLEAYWRGLAGPDGVPYRRDLDATRIEPALPHAFVLERVAAGIARFRTGGQLIQSHLGFDLKGMPVSLLFSAEGRKTFHTWLDRCFDGPALVDLPVATRRFGFRSAASGRFLLLPLRDQQGHVTRAVGGLFLDHSAQLGKVRFDLPDDAPLRCEILRPATGPVYAVAGDRRPKGLAEAQKPYLRLVVSNP